MSLSQTIPGPGPDILHIKTPKQPQFRFEWHQRTKRVYVIRLGAMPEIADPMAYDIDNQGAATNAVLIWLRGYNEGRMPDFAAGLN